MSLLLCAKDQLFLDVDYHHHHHLSLFLIELYMSAFGCAGPRTTVPRILRWAACGAATVGPSSALLVRLFSPECEPQNITAYDRGKK